MKNIKIKKIVILIFLSTLNIISCNKKKDYFYVEKYKNGKIKVQGEIRNNKREGMWMIYYYDGNIKGIGNYLNDKLNGKWTFFGDKNKIGMYGFYINNKKEGVWISNKEDGFYKEYYKNGVCIGAFLDITFGKDFIYIKKRPINQPDKVFKVYKIKLEDAGIYIDPKTIKMEYDFFSEEWLP